MRAAYVFPENGLRSHCLWLTEKGFTTLLAMAHHLGLVVEELGCDENGRIVLKDEGIWERYDEEQWNEECFDDPWLELV
jgi:hypothetical protein